MTDPKTQFIIDNLQENLQVQVKFWFDGLQYKGEKARLAKAIIALVNNGGGYIFIGFRDKGADLPEIRPNVGEFEAFTQDAIAAVVHRYVTPPCQCRLEFATKTGSKITHPVIIVPENHRTPIFTARSRPNNEIEIGKVYVRRLGGQNEAARNQDDWEKLIDRLVNTTLRKCLHAQ